MPAFGPARGRALLVLPSFGLVAVAVALVFGLSVRPVRSAEVYGGPTDNDADYSVRIHVQEDLDGLVRDVAGARIGVIWKGPSSERELVATSGQDGWVEVLLGRPSGARTVRLEVVDRSSEQVLAEGEPVLPRARWQAASQRRGGRLVGHSEGPVFVEARVREAVLAYPFLAHVELSFSAERGHARGAEVEVTVEGAELITPANLTLTTPLSTLLQVRPLGHLASLRLSVKSQDGALSTFYANMPVVPGASWVENTNRGLLVRSPLPRKYAWYAFVNEAGRLSGGRLPLIETKTGVSEGLLPPALVPFATDRYLVLASSADGRSPSTVGYPLDGQTSSFDALDGRLLDGALPAAQREARRLGRLRGLLFIYVGVVSVVTLCLFIGRVRSADADLRNRMIRAGSSELGPGRFGLAAWIAALCLVGGFSLALIWISLSDAVF